MSEGRPPALSLSASLRLPLVERWLEEIAPRSVVEAGCGQGAMAYRLASRFEYRGYEPDATSYQVAAQRLARLGAGEVVHGILPEAADRHFDVLAAFEVLEHIEDDRSALRTWTTWLSPGGHVIISVPAHPNRFGPMDEKVGHFRRYTRGALESVMHDSGLTVRVIESWGMPFGYALESVRNLLARRSLGDSDVGTAGSGRLYQPPSRMGRVVELGVRPMAVLQLPFRSTDLGIGYIAVGRLEG